MLFHIHRMNLATNTGGFPPEGFLTLDEEVELTETSVVLEILFQFIYPRKHPSLVGIAFATLSKVAEAAEKYQVFSAMNVCEIRMRYVTIQLQMGSIINGCSREKYRKHPIEVLNYSVRHGHWDLADQAAPLTIAITLDKIGELMNFDIITAWVSSLTYTTVSLLFILFANFGAPASVQSTMG
jgi:hypothetical protein